MAFISNASGFTLGEGTFNNIHANVVNIHQPQGVKHRGGEHEDDPDLHGLSHGEATQRLKRRHEGERDGLKIIRAKHLMLHHQLDIGVRSEYLLHTGEIKGRAVIVKVFHADSRAREHLEETVSLSKGLLHSNLARIVGISSPTSPTHFIAYENGGWQTADRPLATALRDDLERSIVLGFKMVSNLSVGCRLAYS
ncbi:hypothetical protein FB45DRAFT_885669 [Roridomyces roridus]|uniref:Protein kinase domain-containing protein n=1 Tax=Roridomyces roridus TaxID=1738132 RepID=A0AAD7G0K1_9AGAR|nr:hypothetical protein FB45DRAFT_885669 [Roridomyces roridus]